MWTLTSFMAGRFLQGTTTGRAGRPCGGRYRRDIGLASVRFPEGASGYVASTTNVPTGTAQFCDVPPAGFEPALPPPEGGALSPELRGPYAWRRVAEPTDAPPAGYAPIPQRPTLTCSGRPASTAGPPPRPPAPPSSSTP